MLLVPIFHEVTHKVRFYSNDIKDTSISIFSAGEYSEIEISKWPTGGASSQVDLTFVSLTLAWQIDIMHWITRTALELICQSGLGYSIDSLANDSDLHPYSVAAKQLT